jgi:hypothetical protein
VPPNAGLPAGDGLVESVPKGIGSAASMPVDHARVEAVFAEQRLRIVTLGEVDPRQQATPPPVSRLGRTECW